MLTLSDDLEILLTVAGSFASEALDTQVTDVLRDVKLKNNRGVNIKSYH